MTPAQLRRRLMKIARPFLPPLALSILARTLQLAAGIALLATAGWAAGTLASGGAVDATATVWILVALSVAKGLLRYAEQFCGHLVAFKSLARLRVYFYDALEPQAPAAVEGRETGDLLARVTKDVDRVEVFFAHTLAPATTAVIVPVATVAFAYLTLGAAPAATLAAGLALAGLVVPKLGGQASQAAAAALRAGRGAIAQHVTDSVQGVREVLAFGYQSRRLAEQDALEEPVAAGLAGLNRWIAARRGANLLVSGATLVALFAVLTAPGLAGVLNPGGVTLATLGLGLALAVAGFAPVFAVEDFASDIQQCYASARRLFEVTDADPLVPDPGARDHRPAEGWRARPELTAPVVKFDDVSFRYPSLDGGPQRTEPALDHVSFTAWGGKTTALVGSSGSGKSTVAALLVRAWDPTSGQIRLDGRDLKTYNLDRLRAEIGTTPQRPYLFNDSLAANVKLAKPDATDEELAEAAGLAQLAEVVDGEPEGWEAQVGDLGERFSGGQRQRVALARTLLANPAVIVLDEATSQLDAATEARVLAGVKAAAQGKTVIQIAHRLSTVKDADWIVVLDAGKVVQEGVYADLAWTPGPFQNLLAREKN
jgi:thiol reductant ABC exporter CydC subunit